MRRVSLSVVGGMVIPILLFLGGAFASDLNIGWLAGTLLFAVGWPFEIYSPIFPPPPDCPFCDPTLPAMLASMLCDFIVYALISYAFMWWRGIGEDGRAVFQTLNLTTATEDHAPPLRAVRAQSIGAMAYAHATTSLTDEDRIDAQTFARHPRPAR